MGKFQKTSPIELVSEKTVELLETNEVLKEFGEAAASLVVRNPAVIWAKFILTDDLPNGNQMRIPKTEFSNIIQSGVHMPVKMVEGSIENHENSKPLGVIAHLLEKGNQIIALAALWHKERPSDVEYIKRRVRDNEPVDVSWEILYDRAEIANDGIYDLTGTALAAATVVKDPAYEGRTPFLAVAAKARKWSPAYQNMLSDSAFLYINGDKRYFPIIDKDGNIEKDHLFEISEELKESDLPKKVLGSISNAISIIKHRFEIGASRESILKEAKIIISSLEEITEDKLDELEKLTQRVKELEGKLETVEAELKTKSDALAAKESSFSEQEKELTGLREYKASIEAEIERVRRLEEIKNKFNGAGIEKEDSYFDENADSLLALAPETLDFMIQELVVFSSKNTDNNADDNKGVASKLPNFKNEGDNELTPQELAKALRELKKAK